jgi:6,7-dimethyl-8-ribityllumazine synthase|tara:strand:+ start:95 stop:496 length:402 start_codon:yes stop_codon:yes gene_type:complete
VKQILIINADYYKNINDLLIKSSKKTLSIEKIKYHQINVPGVFEIPVVISKYIRKYDAFLAVGCVIKGETPHFDLICKSTFNALMSLSIKSKKPIGNAIITALNMNQAKVRCQKKGSEAANAVSAVLKNVPIK